MILPANREKLTQWIAEQENLCREVISYLLPQQKVEVEFEEYLPNNNWGMARYQENDVQQANLAQKRFAESSNLNRWGVKHLTNYTDEPSKILISRQSLMTEWVSSPMGPAGFLPTAAHEAAHVSPQVNHNPLYQPWIRSGHDDIWKKVSTGFLVKIQAKFSQQVEAKFKQLSTILNN